MNSKLEVNRQEIANPFVKVLVVAGAFLFAVSIIAWVLFFILPLIGIVVGTTLAMVGLILAAVYRTTGSRTTGSGLLLCDCSP